MVRALRITYVGELGWELYVPVEQAAAVYDQLVAAGEDLGLRDAGYYALDSLRMEKGYRAWGREVSPDDTPLEAGLDWAVRWGNPRGAAPVLVRNDGARGVAAMSSRSKRANSPAHSGLSDDGSRTYCRYSSSRYAGLDASESRGSMAARRL